jgi:hypothetical protein
MNNKFPEARLGLTGSPIRVLAGALMFTMLIGAGVALAAGGAGGGGSSGGGSSGGSSGGSAGGSGGSSGGSSGGGSSSSGGGSSSSGGSSSVGKTSTSSSSSAGSSSAGSSGASAGSGSSGGSAGNSGARFSPNGTDLTTCDKGMVWDRKNKKCLAKRSGVLPDPDLTEYAYSLAKADRFPEAIEVLDMLADPNTPRALNYRGYATRKMGRTDEGISYYMQSVALDPNYAQVREYLGEAFVIQGKFDLANEQLSTIQKICGDTQCEEYEELSDAIHQAQGS